MTRFTEPLRDIVRRQRNLDPILHGFERGPERHCPPKAGGLDLDANARDNPLYEMDFESSEGLLSGTSIPITDVLDEESIFQLRA